MIKVAKVLPKYEFPKEIHFVKKFVETNTKKPSENDIGFDYVLKRIIRFIERGEISV